MGQTEELLNSLTEEQIAAYSSGPTVKEHIVIGDNRYPRVPESLRHLAVQHDHNVETITFDCPRYWDELDMSTMAIHINYMRADGIPGMSPAENIVIDETNPEIMHFDWLVTKHATEVNGDLSFLVCIKNDDEEGNPINHWNSELNKDMYITEGLECDTSIYALYPDIVSYILLRISETTWDCVTTYQQENPLQVDKTLTIQGFAADAKVVGDEIQAVNDRAAAIEADVEPMDFTKQHVWKKTEKHCYFELEIAETDSGVFTLDTADFEDGLIHVYYTDTLSINPTTGMLITGDVHFFEPGIMNNFEPLHPLIGKYVARSREDFEEPYSYASYGDIAYVKSFEGSHYGSGETITFVGDTINRKKINTNKTTVNSLLYGDTPDAYPTGVTDDGTYEYLGLFKNLPSAAGRSQVVCYAGTDLFGMDNPCSISFDFPPKTITFLGHTRYDGSIEMWEPASFWANGNYGFCDVIVTDTLTTEYKSGQGFIAQLDASDSFSNRSSRKAKKSEDGKTIYWYNTDSALQQLNRADSTYYFRADG